jgi:hypothetical protein
LRELQAMEGVEFINIPVINLFCSLLQVVNR